MKRLAPNTWLAIGLGVLLIAVTGVAAVINASPNKQPILSSFSAQPDGAKALALWLQALGYPVDNQALEEFAIPQDTEIVLLLEPTFFITPEEWRVLDQWVEGGGTLIAAGERGGFRQIATRYDFELTLSSGYTQTAAFQTPLLASPPLTATFTIETNAAFSVSSGEAIVHLANGEKQPLLASFEQGKGRVVLAAFAQPLDNQGLKSVTNAALALNLLALAKKADPQPGPIWFDEWHHGLRASLPVLGPESWLRQTPIGHAILLGAGLFFVYLLLQGRGFGRPVPLPRQIRRRGPLEQLTALANLSRRAGHNTAVLQQYRQALKRHFGKRYRLNPTLPDADYLAALERYNPNLDIPALANLLANLRKPEPTEEDVVRLAAEASQRMQTEG